ncbi:hypothetical protein AVEN_134152-1 [Araneus ventricosus]|uniref:Peptidase A9 domain-containing protein n=1 Tax=Araneus ventricosus TaxID=182803 RepID=A0A4Y2JF03_ARAVE|nr:hypothetical protein AVEN_134152-1 [Araneus ventricosus]
MAPLSFLTNDRAAGVPLSGIAVKERTIPFCFCERKTTPCFEATKFSLQPGSESQVSQKGVLVAATLVDLKREVLPVRALNLKNKPKIVDNGNVIATCEPMVDIFAHHHEVSEAQHLTPILENFEILNEEQRRAVRKLFKEFQNLFSTCDADVGRRNMTQHRINTDDHPPMKQYPRRLPLARKEKAKSIVN